MMRRDDVLQKIAAHKGALQQRGVLALYLFGSVARDVAQPNSDVDLLVEFGHPISLFELFRLRFFLQDILGAEVDLIPRDCLREEYREQVEREVLRAA